MKIKKGLLQYVLPTSEPMVRLEAAMGSIELAPPDLLTVLSILTLDKDEDVRKAAFKTLHSSSERVLVSALTGKLDAQIIKIIFDNFKDNEVILEVMAVNDNTGDDVFKKLLSTGSASLCEIVADSARVLGSPDFIEALNSNPNVVHPVAAVVTGDEEQGEESGAISHEDLLAIFSEEVEDEEAEDDAREKVAGTVRAEKSKAVAPDKKEKEEEQPDKHISLYNFVQSMSVSDKVKLACVGNKEARELLIKQSNKVIAKSVIRNPRITEDEILRVVCSRSISEDILREIARRDDWLKNHQIRKGLVTNPKTPVPVALKHVPLLTDKDIKEISKSRNVPNVVASAARRLIAIKEKRS